MAKMNRKLICVESISKGEQNMQSHPHHSDNPIKYKFFVSLISVCFLSSLPVYANSIDNDASTDQRPIYSQNTNDFTGSVSPLVHATPKSLATQKLNNSAYPDEAELFCGTERCVFGLSRGLVVGGDIFGMLSAPLRQYSDRNWVSGGSLYLVDVFAGFQILRDDISKNYMNAQIGYRKINFNDGTNRIASQGITTAVNYSQLITPFYLQSIEFSSFFVVGNSDFNNASTLNVNSPGHAKLNDSASYFYRTSQSYPTYRVALPADLEVISWNTHQTGLEMPIHGYLQIAPFYIQNNLEFNENNLSLQKTEQNFGVRFAAISSYESTAAKAKTGRYALKGQLGLDFSTSNFSTTSSGNADLDLPKRSFVAPYIQLAGSWQF
jgi:hypothetical protein